MLLPKNMASQQDCLNQQKSDDLNNTQSFRQNRFAPSQRQRLTAWWTGGPTFQERQLGQVALASVLHKHLPDWANIVFPFPPSMLHPLAQESVAGKQMAIT